jgi:hypothetical protein
MAWQHAIVGHTSFLFRFDFTAAMLSALYTYYALLCTQVSAFMQTLPANVVASLAAHHANMLCGFLLVLRAATRAASAGIVVLLSCFPLPKFCFTCSFLHAPSMAGLSLSLQHSVRATRSFSR